MKRISIILPVLFSALTVFSNTYYVDASQPDDFGVATNWATAKKTIQAAIEIAVAGDTVLVTDGIYDMGGAVAPDYVGQYGTESNTLTNRVCVDKAVTIQSVNGPDVTIIEGAADPYDPFGLGPAAIRCVYLVPGAVMEGFTLNGGHTAGDAAPAQFHDYMGGGAFLCTNALLDRCILSGNHARFEGGGAFSIDGGTVNNCEITENYAEYNGGGISIWEGGTLNNCTLTMNRSGQGGGVSLMDGEINNCIVWENIATENDANIYLGAGTVRYTCADPLPPGTGNINTDPLFKNPLGNFQLREESPCIDTGSNLYAPGLDINGIARPFDGDDNGSAIADMGCYEWDLSARPITYYVDASRPDDSGVATNWATAKKTIQAAVDLATDADTVMVTNGIYNTGGAIAPDYTNEMGDIEVNTILNRVCIVGAITVRSVNGADATVIDGGWLDRCAYLYSGAVLDGFTLTHGHTLGRDQGGWFDSSGGGAMLLTGAQLNNCKLIENQGAWGGGAQCVDSTLNNCVLSNNTALEGSGGGILCQRSTLNNCVLSTNTAYDYMTYFHGTIVIDGYGGGAYAIESTLNNCLLSGNTARFGGGAYIDAGTMNNCTVSGNSAYLRYTGHIGGDGGGIYSIYTTVLNNCIVWGNNAVGAIDEHSFYSTIRNSCLETFFAGTGNISSDPLFVDAANEDYQLQEGSLCVNSGNNTYAPASPYDLAGNPRIVGAAVDMGAYEDTTPLPMYTITTTAGDHGSITPENPSVFQGNDQAFNIQPDDGYHINSVTVDGSPIALTNSYTFFNVQTNHTIAASFGINADTYYVDASRPDDSGAGTNWATAKQSIQAAIDLVAPTGTVWVTDGVYDIGEKLTPGWNLKNRVCMTKTTALRSVNGPEVTVIQGNAGSSNGGFDNSAIRGVFMQNGSSLSGFTVTNGYTLGGGLTAYEAQGGGIWLTAGCVVSNCIVTGNAASYGGGGVSLYYGGTLNNCLITGNSSRSYSGAGVILKGQSTVNNCTVTDNHAGGESGGGIRMSGEGILNNCIVWGNTAPGPNDIAYAGAAIRNTCSSTEVTDGVNGCITGNPLFVDATNGNFQLQYGSPCINSGNNTYAPPSPYDLAGNPRIIGGTVDMGTYEYNSSSADSNQDGIPDQWYLSYGLDCTDPTISSAHSDSDQQNNRDEYIAGFDPTDALSYFAITGFTNSPLNRIEWDGVPGRVYSVYWTTNLIDGFQPLETNIPWTVNSYTDALHNAYSEGFYSLGVDLVP